MEEFLAKGGKIQQVATGVSGRIEGVNYSAWGAPRKAGRPPNVPDTPKTDKTTVV
jgi:hypothetical protein